MHRQFHRGSALCGHTQPGRAVPWPCWLQPQPPLGVLPQVSPQGVPCQVSPAVCTVAAGVDEGVTASWPRWLWSLTKNFCSLCLQPESNSSVVFLTLGCRYKIVLRSKLPQSYCPQTCCMAGGEAGNSLDLLLIVIFLIP